MLHRRIFISIILMVLALLAAISGVFFYPAPHEFVVPIDRSTLNDTKGIEKSVPIKSGEVDQMTQKSLALRLAPDPRLIEPMSLGLLPRKAENGDRPLNIYARPFDHIQMENHRPKLSIAILNSGMSEIMTAEAYLALPPDISFVMSPYAKDAERQMRDIRNRGHEIFLSIQSTAEPVSHEDRGPYALDPSKNRTANQENLHWMMSRMTGYVGLIGDLTSGASQNEALRDLIKSETQSRGLAYFSIIRADSMTTQIESESDQPNVTPHVMSLFADRPDQLKAELETLMKILQSDKKAIALIAPSPLALDVLKDWLKNHVQDHFDLVPLSAFMRHAEQI